MVLPANLTTHFPVKSWHQSYPLLPQLLKKRKRTRSGILNEVGLSLRYLSTNIKDIELESLLGMFDGPVPGLAHDGGSLYCTAKCRQRIWFLGTTPSIKDYSVDYISYPVWVYN